jgi:hypothetical protein
MQQNLAPRKGTRMALNLLSQELYTPLFYKFTMYVLSYLPVQFIVRLDPLSLLQLRLGKYPPIVKKHPVLINTNNTTQRLLWSYRSYDTLPEGPP